jgi:hypothetical protein
MYLTQYQHECEERQEAHGRSFDDAIKITLLYEKAKKEEGILYLHQEFTRP